MLIFLFILWSTFSWYLYVEKLNGIKIFVIEEATYSKNVPQKKKFRKTIVDSIFSSNSPFKITIEFESNSIKPKNQDTLLLKVLNFYKKKGNKMKIIGFANTETTSELNYKLGRIRAWVIKSKLLKRGISSEKMITSADKLNTSNKVDIISE